MLNCQKTSEEGGGAYDSPEVFPIIFAYSILLALHQRPSALVYNEFGMYGSPTERSEGGTGRGGGMNMLTRGLWDIIHVSNCIDIIHTI
jgi:hypothetical protein